jgi:argonaute-like protein implicated in RNA metabolism and viral defense
MTLSPSSEKRASLAFIALSEEDETYLQPVPLYYRLKALLARTGHPSQMVDYDTLTNPYARWNLALNIAAKLGAIPWTLEDVSVLRPVDLFLGFSYSTIRTDGLGQSRNIAYVNVFDSAGTWRVFCADGNVFSFEDRFRTFPRIASDAVRSATDNPTSLRFIEVHYNKRFGFKERQAIANGIRSQAPNASIVFVSIADSHPVRLFDPTNSQHALGRGAVLQLGEGTSYIQTIDSAKATGLPRPLRVQVYRDFCLANDDPLDISKRVLALTRLNWRSVKDFSSLPVTVLYSSLVARLTNYFSLTDWKDIDHSLKRTPWFL